jgi:transcriptional regulator with XRE-family HTH domain
MEPHDFCKKIKDRREALGLSQNDLALALGIDQGKVSLLEKGARRIDVVKELPILARTLNVSVGWFYDQEGDSVPAHALVKQFFPDVEFNEVDLKRVAKFIEPIVESYVKADPSMSEQIQKQKKAMGE